MTPLDLIAVILACVGLAAFVSLITILIVEIFFW